MQRKRTNKVNSPEFKIMVIEVMRKEKLSYHETVRRLEWAMQMLELIATA